MESTSTCVTTNTSAKRGYKAMMVIAIVLASLILLNVIGFAVNKIAYSGELKSIPLYGKLVEVNGKNMHVSSIGNGPKTVVLLPGFGISLPCADFGPLMRELSKQDTVVCVEYFGTGFSDPTDTPRTNSNYVEEIRSALSQAGFAPPYVLMPHSASGVYSEYYAAKYPQEVSAIVMLDTTSTVISKEVNPPKFIYSIAKLQQACGFTRITYRLVKPAQKSKNGYTEQEIADYRTFSYHVLNDTIIDQSYRLLDNIKEVNALDYPQNIPVLKLISGDTWKKVGEAYQTEHIKRLGTTVQTKVIEGSHFIYQTKVDEIADAATAFLK